MQTSVYFLIVDIKFFLLRYTYYYKLLWIVVFVKLNLKLQQTKLIKLK